MNDPGIISGILVFAGALLFVARAIKRLGDASAKPLAGAPMGQAPLRPQRPALPLRHPERVEGQPRTSFVVADDERPQSRSAAVPRRARDDSGVARDDMGTFARDLGAADAFPGLDLTLPDADGPAVLAVPRRAGKTFRGNALPGRAGWGANAIVAMEILGPPVSLRSGATLGAPHAF